MPATFPELAQVIAGLIDDVEKAKQFSADQINHLMIEKDEALRNLSLLKEQQEIDSQEKDDLRLQVSILTDELEALKPELEMTKTDRSRAQEEARSMLFQVQELQAELERYFLISCDQSRLLEASAKLQARSTALLLKAVN